MWRRALAGVALGQLAAGLAGLGIAARKRVAVGPGRGTSEPVDRSSGVVVSDKPRRRWYARGDLGGVPFVVRTGVNLRACGGLEMSTINQSSWSERESTREGVLVMCGSGAFGPPGHSE